MIDIKAIREAAEAATPGPWWHGECNPADGHALAWMGNCFVDCVGGQRNYHDPSLDAKHIATANPATVLALCDEIERLRKDADAYNHACDEMERWQAARAAAGKEVGTTGSLCDGMAWLYGRLDELEAALKPGEPVARFNWNAGGFEWLTKYNFETHNMQPLYLAPTAQTKESITFVPHGYEPGDDLDVDGK